MKIGFIYTKFLPLGSSASVHGYQVAKHLKEQGHELYTLGLGANELTTDFPKSISGILKFIRTIDVVYIRINPWLYNDWFSLLKLISFGKIKVIWELNAPVEEVLASYQGSELPRKVKAWIRKQNKKRRFFARFCDGAVSVSKIMDQYASEELEIRQHCAVSNGSDTELFSSASSQSDHILHDTLKDKFVVIWAGNALVPWQGIGMIRQLATEFSSQEDVVFVTVSNQAVYVDSVAENIICLSEVKYTQLPELLSLADVALCVYENYNWSPYGFYGSPLKLYDYMSMGLPVIASSMGQITDVVIDGENGFLTDNDLSEMGKVIQSLKDNALDGKKVGEAARQTVIDKHQWAAKVKTISDFINTCAKGNK